MNWYLAVLKNYAVFSGRARRKEYWLFILFHILIYTALAIIAVLGTSADMTWLVVLPISYLLGTIIPMLAVVVRRLHDTGRSGWMYLLNFIPLVGPIILIIFLATDGERRANAYGPPVK